MSSNQTSENSTHAMNQTPPPNGEVPQTTIPSEVQQQQPYATSPQQAQYPPQHYSPHHQMHASSGHHHHPHGHGFGHFYGGFPMHGSAHGSHHHPGYDDFGMFPTRMPSVYGRGFMDPFFGGDAFHRSASRRPISYDPFDDFDHVFDSMFTRSFEDDFFPRRRPRSLFAGSFGPSFQYDLINDMMDMHSGMLAPFAGPFDRGFARLFDDRPHYHYQPHYDPVQHEFYKQYEKQQQEQQQQQQQQPPAVPQQSSLSSSTPQQPNHAVVPAEFNQQQRHTSHHFPGFDFFKNLKQKLWSGFDHGHHSTSVSSADPAATATATTTTATTVTTHEDRAPKLGAIFDFITHTNGSSPQSQFQTWSSTSTTTIGPDGIARTTKRHEHVYDDGKAENRKHYQAFEQETETIDGVGESQRVEADLITGDTKLLHTRQVGDQKRQRIQHGKFDPALLLASLNDHQVPLDGFISHDVDHGKGSDVPSANGNADMDGNHPIIPVSSSPSSFAPTTHASANRWNAAKRGFFNLPSVHWHKDTIVEKLINLDDSNMNLFDKAFDEKLQKKSSSQQEVSPADQATTHA